MRSAQKVLAAVLMVFAAAVILSACGGSRLSDGDAYGPPSGSRWGGGRGMMMGPGMMRGYPGGVMGSTRQRHRGSMMGGIPAAYRGLRNPLLPDPSILSEGRSLYQARCAACHGNGGLGDGPAAAGLSTPPANLRWTLSRPMASDGYLMWAISEGGAAFGTPMPAFKDALSESDRWKIIQFLRTL